MTVTERERRKDELLQCGVHRAELCVMVANLEYDLANLKDKHGQLKKDNEQLNNKLARLRTVALYAVKELTKEVIG